MKMLLIIKDSFKQALDKKVFYVLAIISIFFTLLCFSLGFEDKEPEEVIRSNLEYSERFFKSKGIGQKSFEIEDFNKIPEEPANDFAGGYEFEILFNRKATNRLVESRLKSFGIKKMKVKRIPSGYKTRSKFKVLCRMDDLKKIKNGQRISFLFGLIDDFGKIGLSTRELIAIIESTLANTFAGWIGVIIAIIVTANFVPSMLTKGSIDLILSKPIQRVQIIVAKYLGGLSFVFLNAAILIVGTWLGLSIRSGFYNYGYLGCILVVTFLFAIVYSMSTLTAIIFESPIVSIVVSILFWMICGGIAIIKYTFLKQFEFPNIVEKIVNVLYIIFPKTSDLGNLNGYFLLKGNITDPEMAKKLAELEKIPYEISILSSFIFILVILIITSIIFSMKDY